MLLIFGMRSRSHQHGACVAASCPRCHNEVVLIYLVVTRWFTLFFIPVIPTSKRRMLMCPICQWNREVPKASEHLAVEMIGITEQWKTKQLGDAEYGQRVEAFWSFISPEAGKTQPSNQPPYDQAPDSPSGPSQTPPAPPAPPPSPPAS
jgi:zinc-ribbon family